MSNIHHISSGLVDFSRIRDILSGNYRLVLSEDSINKIIKCREYLDNRLSRGEEILYGINTGFGSLHHKVISVDDLGTLQRNLVMSHACGVGDEVPQEVVKLMLFLKIQSLSYGNSGVQLSTVERLIDFFNEDILPVVYQYGSLGASGDLAPLAHMSLPLIGMGEVNYKENKYSAHDILKKFRWKPIELQSKEGLALLNGTQFMSAYGVLLCLKVFHLSDLADITGALSLDAFDGRIEPFHDLIQQIRPDKTFNLAAQRHVIVSSIPTSIRQVGKHFARWVYKQLLRTSVAIKLGFANDIRL